MPFGGNIMGFIILFIFLLLAFLGLDLYFFFSWKKFIRQQRWHNLCIYFVLGILVSASVSLAMLFINGSFPFLSPIIERILLVFISIWYLPKIVIIPFIFIKDIIFFGINKYKKFHFKAPDKSNNINLTPVNDNAVSNKRRKIVKTAGWALAATPFLSVANGAIRTTYNFKIHRVEIPINNLPFALDGLKIAQISDIHSGSFISDKQIREVRTIVNTIQPDILFVTGDFVNHSPKEYPLIAEHLQAMEARLGKFGILGNHDHYMTDENHQKLIKAIKDSGIDLLINENRVININDTKLQIAGVDDLSFRNKFGNLDAAFSGLSQEYRTILLCHDPKPLG